MVEDQPTSMRVRDAGIRTLFTRDARWQAWLDVEAALARAEAEIGMIPEAAAEEIVSKAKLELLDPERIIEGLRVTGHGLVPLIWAKTSLGEARTVFTSATTRSVQNAAAAGMGLALLPCYVGDSDARLVRVSDPLQPLKIEFWILTHPDLKHTVRVRAMMEFLYARLKAERDLFEGDRPGMPARLLYRPAG